MHKVIKKVIAGGLCIFMMTQTVLSVQASPFSGNIRFSEYLDTDTDLFVGRENLPENEYSQMKSEPEMVYISSIDGTVRNINFDSNWKFYLGNNEEASQRNYNDAGWEEVDLPHDYSITQNYSQNLEAESAYLPGGVGWYRKSFFLPASLEGKSIQINFDGVYMDATIWVNGERVANHPYGYTPFTMDISRYLSFGEDNLIAVKVNHQLPSSRWYSGSGIYRSVQLVVKDRIHIVEDGIKISYTGLESSSQNVQVHVDTGIQNDTDATQSLSLQFELKKKGQEDILVQSESGAREVQAGENNRIQAEFSVNNPDLWDLSNPNLYTLTTKLVADNRVLDQVDTDFGFRYFAFDANQGFSLNGQRMKLKGVCMHHDQGALGAAAYEDAMRRQIEILKEMGSNAIRITHNPGAKRFVELCDEIGMLVVEEAFDGWHSAKNGNQMDYSRFFAGRIGADGANLLGASEDMTWAEFDLRSMIRRDYNSPSVIMWSLGNEVSEGAANMNETYLQHARNLSRWSLDEDSTRKITFGDNKLKASVNPASLDGRKAENLFRDGGILGVNYMDGSVLDRWHAQKPDWLLYESETASAVNSRGIYKIDGYKGKNGNNQLTSYDVSTVNWGKVASRAWYDVITRDFNAGEFVWTGFDYLGEPTHWNGTDRGPKGGTGRSWPAPKNSFFGIVDTAGLQKDSYYLYRSLWREDSTTLHVLPAWKENVLQTDAQGNVKVAVYSNAKAVRLTFTQEGSDVVQDLGLKAFTAKTSAQGGYSYQLFEGSGRSNNVHENLYLTWNVPYRNGKLEAIAYSDVEGTQVISETVGQSSVRTPGTAAKLRARVYGDRSEIKADGKSLAYIEIDVTDANGHLVPDADPVIYADIEGAGRIIAMDNGNSMDHDAYRNPQRRAFGGKVVAIVQSVRDAGEIRVNLRADGLEGETLILNSVAAEAENTQRKRISYKLSRNYYLKRGSELHLDPEIQTFYNDGAELTEQVEWEEVEEHKLNSVGSFSVSGRFSDGREIFVKVHVIDKVAAVLNYSDTVEPGKAPILPDSRPGVFYGGTVLDVNFPVTWEEKSEEEYREAGIVEVNGNADVFGELYPVVASIRVGEEQITLGPSVSAQALELSSYQGGKTYSDTLEAVKDGSYASTERQDSNWRNLSRWSNWSASREGVNEASLTFRYATQFRLGEVAVYFTRDNSSLRYPEPGTTSIEVSDDGIHWSAIQAEEIIDSSEISERVKKYTYRFTPIAVTFVKVNIRNAQRTSDMTSHVSTGITEIELRSAQGNFASKTTAKLESLSINKKAVSQSDLDNNRYATQALFIDEIEYKAKDNAAVTYIPSLSEGKEAYLYMESEDHKKNALFTIVLDANKSYPDANFSERDYDYQKTSAQAGDEEPREPVGRAVDGRIDTMWHTNWSRATTLEQRYITLTMEEETLIDGLRYLARIGNDDNGRVKKYAVDILKDGEWVEAASGEWPNQSGYHSADFAPVMTTQVRLRGIETYNSGHSANKYMSAVEVRIRKAEPVIDIAGEGFRIDMPTRYIKVESLYKPVKPQIEVHSENGQLRYGLDYRIRYVNNDRPGRALAIVEGIEAYGGRKEIPFYIVSTSARELSVENADIYLDGEKLDSRRMYMEPGQEVELRWDDDLQGANGFWSVMPFDFAYTTVDEMHGSSRIKFTMPEHSLRFKALQVKTGERNLFGVVQTVPGSWFVDVEEEVLISALESTLSTTEQERILQGEAATLKLQLNRSETKPASIATASDASEADTNAFYIEMKATRQIGQENEFETIEDRILLPMRIEVPKQDRNMSDYQVIAFDRTGISDPYVVQSAYEDGFLRFIADTDTIIGVYYNKTVEVEFVDYDDRVLERVYLKPGQTPAAPQSPEREGYEFVKWNREFRPVYAKTTFKAVYKKEVSVDSKQRDTNSDTKENHAEQTPKSDDTRNTTQKNQGTVNRGSGSGGRGISGSVLKINTGGNAKKSEAFRNNLLPSVELKGSWQKAADKWRFKDASGELVKNRWAKTVENQKEIWYLFDENGELRTGWYQAKSGIWYYLSEEKNAGEGQMQSGWIWVKSADGRQKCYFLNANGELLQNTVTPDGYRVNANGEWIHAGIVQVK